MRDKKEECEETIGNIPCSLAVFFQQPPSCVTKGAHATKTVGRSTVHRLMERIQDVSRQLRAHFVLGPCELIEVPLLPSPKRPASRKAS